MTTSLQLGHLRVQGAGETIIYVLDVSSRAISPTTPSVTKVVDLETGSDVKATVMPTGTASVSGNNVTLPALKSLTVGRTYRVHFTYVKGSETFESTIVVRCNY